MFWGRQDADHLCGDCIQHPKHFGIARAVGSYNNLLAALIHRFKYHGVMCLAEPFSRLMFMSFEHHWRPGSIDLVMPMPLHTKRLRQRKFNQSTRLLSDWGRLKRAGKSRLAGWLVETGSVSRIRYTPPQAGLNRRQRLRNIKNAFRVSQPERIKEKRVLLIDDVFTTGATVNECARSLIESGALQVDVLTLARARP